MREENVCIKSGHLRSVPEEKTDHQKVPQSPIHAWGEYGRSIPISQSTNNKKLKIRQQLLVIKR